MYFTNLEVFLLVSEVCSFSKAAKLLHLSQPSVSNQIRMLEEYFHITLFERSPNGVTLTEAGKEFLPYAKKILLSFEEIKDLQQKFKKSEKKRIVIGADTIIGNYMLPFKICSFQELHPNLEIIVSTTEIYDNLFKQLEQHEIDIAFIDGTPPSQYNFQTKLITTEPLYLAVPNNDRWKNIDSIRLDELYKLQFVFPNTNLGLRHTIEKEFHKQGIDLKKMNITTELNSICAIKSVIESGYGASFLCHLASKREVTSGSIKFIEVEKLSFNLPYYILYRDEKSNPEISQFINFLTSKVKI